MAALNAAGHVMIAASSDGLKSLDNLWDLGDELAMRVTGDTGAMIYMHSLGGPPKGLPRYCVHPYGETAGAPEAPEFQGDNLRTCVMRAVTWLAGQLDEDDVWRRDG